MKKSSLSSNLSRTQTLLFLPAAGLLVFAILAAFSQPRYTFDQKVFDLIAPSISETNTRFFKFITFYGNHAFLIPANLLLLLYFIIRKNKLLAVTVAAVEVSSLVLMNLLKMLTQRHRPPEPMVSGITNYSFPSGHAFMCVAFYGLLVWMLFRYEKIQWRKYLLSSVLVLLMLIIGFSRVYLRVHYASDVIAGYCIGLIWLMLILTLIQRMMNRTPALNNEGQGL
ncbi:MAG: phosphatase PAP2 family protein [Chitinophagaceae bacterium]|nr:phosphatase PAP2 family protein [Chitinophagaceae bacterium]